jgi:hypothetical protein
MWKGKKLFKDGVDPKLVLKMLTLLADAFTHRLSSKTDIDFGQSNSSRPQILILLPLPQEISKQKPGNIDTFR